MPTSRILLCLIFLLFAIGCAPRLTFDVSVTNETRDPITLGIVKTAPPFERDFAGPERFAIDSPQAPSPPWGHVVPPGRTIDSPPVTGSFPEDARAYLRVYRGEHSNAQLMAISEPSPDRIEILIFPGHNRIIIHDDPKGLRGERIEARRP
jgi:hypothetical protein